MVSRIEVERVDNIPIIVETLKKMEVQEEIDKHHEKHGNEQGLSLGWLALVFLTYILAEESHKMVTVESWAMAHRHTLERVTGQRMRRTDFTDDRIGKLLYYLSKDRLWLEVDEEISQHSIRVYEMDTGEAVRLDATVGEVYHEEKESVIFKVGKNKEGGFGVQFKIMWGTLDPMGLVIGADVVSGEKADDPLYVPIYKRIRKTLGKEGRLYVGDSKMGALETRAVIEKGKDYYLMPLAMVGEIPELLGEKLKQVKGGEIKLQNVYMPEDRPTNADEKPDESKAIAEGFEIERQQEDTVDGEKVIWNERLFIIRSKAFAEAQIKHFEAKLGRVEAKIMNLTPPPGRGKKQIKDELVLEQKVEKILKTHQVTDYYDIKLERQSSHRQVRGYKGKVGRTEEKLRYQVHLKRRQKAIEQNKFRLGWRIYATNEVQAKLNLNDAVLAYRSQYLVEGEFARLKGSLLKMLPLYVKRDDHALGLIRLLTVALRTLTIIEFVARRSLAQKGEEALSRIYQGNPKRKTHRPSVGLLLSAFNNISLVIQYNDKGEIEPLHLTPLNQTQQRILSLLGMSTELYSCLLDITVIFPFVLPKEKSVVELI
jgi:transposase